MNVTQRTDGVLKPLESLELHRAQSYIRSVYYTGLADRLQKLGYAIEIDRDTGAPEIKGISKEYRVACSPRRAEILELAEKAGKNFRQLGLVNRREKIFDKNLIQEQHRGIDGFFDYQAERVVKSARENPRPTAQNPLSVKEAKEAVTFALAKLSERESVFEPRNVLLEANRRGIGRTSVTAIEAEFETRKKAEQIKTIRLSDGRDAAFLSADEKIEAELPQHIKVLKPKETLRDEYFKNVSPSVNAELEKQFAKLANEQQYAVVDILTAETGVTTLEGRAGVGKTTTLSFVNIMAEKANYEVLALAPTTGAAQELGNAQIQSLTLQKLLASKDAPREQKRFFIVDESSFVSSRQMDKFFREAVKTGDRVLLAGDTRQHEGVEAGKPFARIQREELTSGAKIETIRRQTKETDRETVKKLSEGKIIEAIGEMRQRGQVREIKDRADRHTAIVEAFSAEPEKSMVVAPRNADRQEINSKIHTALKDAGKVGKDETEIKILRPRSELRGIEREFAATYREGDIISYTRGSTENKIAAKSLAKVIKSDREQNLLTVEIKDGRDGTQAREVTYNPKRLRGVSVWTEETIKVSEGDRLQFRAPFEEKQTKIANGTMFEVSKITPESLTLTTNKGKVVKLNTDQPHAIDYGYVVTSHSSPEKTIDRVLIHAETSESKQILNERIAYVAVSRARDEALIFTNDAEQLSSKMARRIEKSEISQAKTETIEPAAERAQENSLDAKVEVAPSGRGEIKQPAGLPVSRTLPAPNIKIQPTPAETVDADSEPIKRRETLIKEILQLSRESLAKQIIEHSEEAWNLFANDGLTDLADQEIPENHKQFLGFLQEDVPQSKRINLTGKSKLESTHAILKLVSGDGRDRIVNSIFAKYEVYIAVERSIENAPERTGKTVLDAKAEVQKAERSEIKPPVILPAVEKSPPPKIKTQPAQENIIIIGDEPKKRQEILIREVLQLSRNSLAKQNIEPDAEAWKRYANDIINAAPKQNATDFPISVLKETQRNVPASERVNIEGKSRLEAIHLMLKSSPEIFRQEFVEGRLKIYEQEIKAEREEIKQPARLPVAEKLPMPEIKIEQSQGKTIDTGDEAKKRQKILVREVLQINQESLAKQGIEPDAEVWKQFANIIINDLPNQKVHESQERLLESLQKDAPPSERVDLAGKSRLEAAYAILKLATEEKRDQMIKTTLADYKQQIKVERGEMAKPEVKEIARITSFEKTAAEVKPMPKVRDFEAIEREPLISELVAAASDEARRWTGEDLSYKYQKRLTKMYRQIGDIKPLDKQLNDLKNLQERFNEPLPQPKNFIEATVLKLDNITDAEKSASLRQQLTGLDEIIKSEKVKEIEFRTENLLNIQPYFIRDPEGADLDAKYFAQIAEAQSRYLVQQGDGYEQMQKTIEQMQNADLLQEQIKRSLDEQGIKLEPLAQRIVNTTVDSYINQPPTQEESIKVQQIAQSTGNGLMIENRLEAVLCIYAHSGEEERDRLISSQTAEASERAEEIRAIQKQEQGISIQMKNEYENEENEEYEENEYEVHSRSFSM